MRPELWQLLVDFLDPNECRLDHHGFCQQHGWLTDHRPCPHARARRLIEAQDCLPQLPDDLLPW